MEIKNTRNNLKKIFFSLLGLCLLLGLCCGVAVADSNVVNNVTVSGTFGTGVGDDGTPIVANWSSATEKVNFEHAESPTYLILPDTTTLIPSNVDENSTEVIYHNINTVRGASVNPSTSSAGTINTLKLDPDGPATLNGIAIHLNHSIYDLNYTFPVPARHDVDTYLNASNALSIVSKSYSGIKAMTGAVNTHLYDNEVKFSIVYGKDGNYSDYGSWLSPAWQYPTGTAPYQLPYDVMDVVTNSSTPIYISGINALYRESISSNISSNKYTVKYIRGASVIKNSNGLGTNVSITINPGSSDQYSVEAKSNEIQFVRDFVGGDASLKFTISQIVVSDPKKLKIYNTLNTTGKTFNLSSEGGGGLHYHDFDTDEEIIFDQFLNEQPNAKSGDIILSKSGNYVMTADLYLKGKITVPAGVDVKLCLDGFKLIGNESTNVFDVKGNLTLYDCREDSTGGLTLLNKPYKRLEYIQSNMNQYINTGIAPSAGLSTSVDFQLTSWSGGYNGVIGSASLIGGDWRVYYVDVYNNKGYKLRVALGNGNGQAVLGSPNTNRHNVTLNALSPSASTYTYDGGTGNLKPFTNPSNANVIMFGHWLYNSGKYTTYLSNCKIYSCTMLQGGASVRNFVPCVLIANISASQDSQGIARSAGTVGMWDTVNDKFYTNVNTAAFIAGPENSSRGVQVNGGNFVLESGIITGFTATNGSAVYLASGSATLKGGNITGNFGKAVYVTSAGTFSVEGTPVVTGNFGENIHLASGAKMTVSGALKSGAVLYVNASKGAAPGTVFTSGWNAKMSGTDPATYIKAEDGKLLAVNDTATGDVKFATRTISNKLLKGTKFEFADGSRLGYDGLNALSIDVWDRREEGAKGFGVWYNRSTQSLVLEIPQDVEGNIINFSVSGNMVPVTVESYNFLNGTSGNVNVSGVWNGTGSIPVVIGGDKLNVTLEHDGSVKYFGIPTIKNVGGIELTMDPSNIRVYKDGVLTTDYTIGTEFDGRKEIILDSPDTASVYRYEYIGKQLGDANEDGDVDSIDASSILSYVLDTDRVGSNSLLYADVNGNGVVNVMDARMIAMWTVGLL